MKKYFDQKVKGCEYLVNLNAKKINKTHIVAAAKKVGLSVSTMERAWTNFVQTGGKFVDKDVKQSRGDYNPQGTYKIPCVITKQRAITAKEAAEIILRYMNERNTKASMLCNEYKITKIQFYDLINELNVTGTLLGTKILDHKKYAKVKILDAIWLYKLPETRRGSIKALTATERLAYQRVGDVLVHYLSAI